MRGTVAALVTLVYRGAPRNTPAVHCNARPRRTQPGTMCAIVAHLQRQGNCLATRRHSKPGQDSAFGRVKWQAPCPSPPTPSPTGRGESKRRIGRSPLHSRCFGQTEGADTPKPPGRGRPLPTPQCEGRKQKSPQCRRTGESPCQPLPHGCGAGARRWARAAPEEASPLSILPNHK
jgi:hypothetical protein